jgi:hypothetical protein
MGIGGVKPPKKNHIIIKEENDLEQTYPSPSKVETKSSCTSLILLILAWSYTVGISFGRIGIAFVATAFEYQLPESTHFILAVGQAVFLLAPLGLLALLWKEPRSAGIYRAWTMAGGLGLLFAPIHLTRPYLAQPHAILHILLVWVYITLLLFITRRQRRSSDSYSTANDGPKGLGILVAMLAGGLFAFPWLALGALGSLLDTLLQTTAAISIGILAALIIETGLLHAFRTNRPTGQSYLASPGDLLLVGFSASTVLFIIASATAFGYGGMQLVLMLCLPSIGWIVAWLSVRQAFPQKQFSRKILSTGITIGLALAAPITLVDPSELHFLVSAYAGEIFQVALKAAGISALIGMLLSVLSIILFARESRQELPGANVNTLASGRRLRSLVAASWATGAFIYFLFGQPGFFGDSLFVILEEQAVVPHYIPGQDYYQHRIEVYDTLVSHAQETQTGLRSDLERFRLRYTPYYLVNGLEVHGGPLVRAWLASRPEVDRVLLNPWMRPLPSLPASGLGTEPAPKDIPWNLILIKANKAWDELGITGQGIVVGQSDSGVQVDHPELAGNYRGREDSSNRHDYNWYDPWYDTESPRDLNGHGTHTLGTVAGLNTGVAPGATWYSCANLVRVFGNPALYLDCMQFMLAPFPIHGDPFLDGEPEMGAQITNNSWGCPELEGCDPNALLPAVRALRAAGIFVVVSAGNDGPACETVNAPLALYDEVTSVGAIDQAGQLAYFSSLGPVTADGSGRTKPDILAPGFDILSAFPGSTYSALPGTSMAGPHVAGVVALIWAANPALIGDIDRTEQILAQSTQPYRGNLPDCPGANEIPSTAFGYGIVDAYAAVRLALDQPGP